MTEEHEAGPEIPVEAPAPPQEPPAPQLARQAPPVAARDVRRRAFVDVLRRIRGE